MSYEYAGTRVPGYALVETPDGHFGMPVGSSSLNDHIRPTTDGEFEQWLNEGALVSTPNGQRPVETLLAGDSLLTLDSQTTPLLGRDAGYIDTLMDDPLHVLPVCIPAGALAEGLPARNLMLSPAQAMLIDNVLVEARCLVDGMLITRLPPMPGGLRVHRLRTARHVLLSVESTILESCFVPPGGPYLEGWAAKEVPSHDTGLLTTLPYPRARSVRQLPRGIRTKLAARAAQIQQTS